MGNTYATANRKGTARYYEVDEYIEEIDALVINVKITKGYETARSRDMVTVKHNCCGNIRSHSVSQLSGKLKKVERNLIKYPKLCLRCALKIKKRKDETFMKPNAKTEKGPRWPVPALNLSHTSYYGDPHVSDR